jgi:hypothetical protein
LEAFGDSGCLKNLLGSHFAGIAEQMFDEREFSTWEWLCATGGCAVNELPFVPGRGRMTLTQVLDQISVGHTVTRRPWGDIEGRWAADPDARVYLRPRGGGVDVDGVHRGRLPEGSAGLMIYRTIQTAGLAPPSSVRFTNVINRRTLDELAAGVTPSETLLGKTLRNMARALGAEVHDWRYELGEKPWIEATLKYP